MSQIKFTVRVLDVTSQAADGSTVPRRSWEAYLSSTGYSEIIKNKTAIGGWSHKNRRLTPELKGLVGMDDYAVIDDNALFYVTKLYFKPGDNFLYADAETFDPQLFAGKRKDNIINLQGMLMSGMVMPISMVLQALWSRSGVAEKIIKYKGFDFTLNPSFKGAGMEAGSVEVFSETVDDKSYSDDQIKAFSTGYNDVTFGTRVFSTEAQVIPISKDKSVKSNLFDKMISESNQDTISYSDIVSTYGQGSTQERLARGLQGKKITKEDLLNLTVDNPGAPEEDSDLKIWLNAVKGISDDKEDRLSYVFRSNRDKLHNIINSVPNSDPRKDELIRARLQQYFRVLPEYELEKREKEYSVIQSVGDRLNNQSQPRYTKIERVVKAYTQFWNSKKLGEDQKLSTKLLFLQDINLLVKEVLPQIKEGRTLNSLYGLSRYGKAVKDSSDKLSITYRKVMIAESIMKFVPKALYADWMLEIQEFYNNLLQYTFNEGLTQFQLNLIDIK